MMCRSVHVPLFKAKLDIGSPLSRCETVPVQAPTPRPPPCVINSAGWDFGEADCGDASVPYHRRLRRRCSGRTKVRTGGRTKRRSALPAGGSTSRIVI